MSNDSKDPNEGELILYRTPEGTIRVEVLYESETFWLNQKRIAALFGVEIHTVSYHLKEIYESGELTAEATLRKIRRVQTEGKREVRREIEFYNLDAIISVGYRVNSSQATQFRIWATQTTNIRCSPTPDLFLPRLPDVWRRNITRPTEYSRIGISKATSKKRSSELK